MVKGEAVGQSICDKLEENGPPGSALEDGESEPVS